MTPIPGSNMPLAAIGVFLLWLGWFGFNGGSVLSADPELTSLVLVTTCLAAAAGASARCRLVAFVSSKPDLSMALNGILAGLVGITAGADVGDAASAMIIGLVAGVHRGGLGALLRSDQDRRPGRRHLGAPDLRHLGHAGRRHLLDEPRAQLVTQLIGVSPTALFTGRPARSLCSSAHQGDRWASASAKKRSSKASTSASTACTPTTSATGPGAASSGHGRIVRRSAVPPVPRSPPELAEQAEERKPVMKKIEAIIKPFKLDDVKTGPGRDRTSWA